MNALLSAAQWVVGKALAPVADGVLEAWSATNNLGLNIEALKMELLLVKATLELAAGKHISGQAMEELLGKLRHSAHCAEDLLDELDYFRIHDELHGTYDAADHHAKGCFHDLAHNARHTAKAVLGLSACSSSASPDEPEQVEDARQRVGCCAWSRGRQRTRGKSSTPNANQEVSGCMPKLGKLLPCSSSPHVHDDNSGQSTLCGAPQREHAEETPMPRFNRVDVSERMKHIVEHLQPVRREVTKILQSCDRITAPDFSQTRPITTGQSIEPKLYGRDQVVNTMIHDMTKGKYHSKDLTVLPIVGPGGIGKTTLIQHIYNNKEVQNHFQVMSWVCVSLRFSLDKLLEDIKKDIPPVDGEKGDRPEQLIEQRLKSKRFLIVLDDIWECSNEDEWKRLLLPLQTSQKEGSIILVTTRFPAIAKMVETTNHIDLEGLESEHFRKLFHAFVFGDDQCRNDHSFLLETGDKIMEKLKGSPLAAKTVGALLRKDLNLRHWRRVLESKEWERQTGANDIMPALKLSYDYLPIHLQQCFYYAALFPEDFHFRSSNLINLWIGLDILQPESRNRTLQDIGLSNLNDLVEHGFFKEEGTNDCSSYVMHDLLHDLALQVASHDCISLHHSNMGSVEIQPSIRHMSIIIDVLGVANGVSNENFKSELRKLKTRLKVDHLQTLMLFGEMDESFANILGDLFREANALRVLQLRRMPCPVESILHNFSTLIHLRYLCLGTKGHVSEMQLPLAISRLYHLRILDLGSWYGCSDLPRDLSNLAKLCRFYTSSDEHHADIYNVGKLRLLEELTVFRVNKENEGFEPTQLEHLAELRELGIYNLENIHTEEEAAKAKLIEKNYLERLTLVWDARSNSEPDVEEMVLESLQPHRYLQELCVSGHGGPSGPAWLITLESLESLRLVGVSWHCLPSLGKMWGLGKVRLEHMVAMEEFVIEQSFRMLIRLELVGLGSFKKWVPSQDTHHMFPLLQALIIGDCPKLLELPFSNHIVYPKPDQNWNIDWFPKLQELEIMYCPELLLVAQIPWTGTLCHVDIGDVRLLEKFEYDPNSGFGVRLEIVGKGDLQSLDQVVAFNKLTGLECLDLRKCPPLEWKHLLMLTSLKKLCTDSLDGLVGPSSGCEAGVEWQQPVVQELRVGGESLGGPSGKELTELLTHLPSLSDLEIRNCKKTTQVALVVGLDLQQTKSAATLEVEQEKEEEEEEEEEEEDGLLLFPTHLSDSLRTLQFWDCPELVLVDPLSALLPAKGGGRGFQAMLSLKVLLIRRCPKIFSAKSLFSSPSCCLFPPSLQILSLWGVEGLGTLEPLSNLTSLTLLMLFHCGEDLRCKGLEPLLTAATGGQLRELDVRGSPGFFAGWDPNPRRVLQDGGGEEQELQQLVSPPSSSKLQLLYTDDATGLLTVPICSLLSSSITRLGLYGTSYREMERFTREQEDTLLLLASLQEIVFEKFNKLQSLPATLHKLTNLKVLRVSECPAVRSLPKDGLPKSLQELNVRYCGSEELNEDCRGLVGTIPRIYLQS